VSAETEPKPRRRNYHQSITVDVEIDEAVLEENGYHHEDDCPSTPTHDDTDVPDHETNRRRLSDWHDEAHGLVLWTMCPHQPCATLTDEFRSSR
jgi:hypothetical protein